MLDVYKSVTLSVAVSVTVSVAVSTRRPASADRTARAANFRRDLKAT